MRSTIAARILTALIIMTYTYAILTPHNPTIAPVITGAMVGLWGVRIAYVYVIIMSAVSILAAIVLRMNTSEEEDL